MTRILMHKKDEKTISSRKNWLRRTPTNFETAIYPRPTAREWTAPMTALRIFARCRRPGFSIRSITTASMVSTHFYASVRKKIQMFRISEIARVLRAKDTCMLGSVLRSLADKTNSQTRARGPSARPREALPTAAGPSLRRPV